jgi:hypothetical protein
MAEVMTDNHVPNYIFEVVQRMADTTIFEATEKEIKEWHRKMQGRSPDDTWTDNDRDFYLSVTLGDDSIEAGDPVPKL